MSKPPFVPVPSPFGTPGMIDERASTEAFEEYVGGVANAQRLLQIWGTCYDVPAWKRGTDKVSTFRGKVVRAGFTIEDADAFLSLQGE